MPTECNKSHIQGILKKNGENTTLHNFVLFLLEKSFQKLVLRVSSGFQTLENNKTTRPATSWFQIFSRVWKPDETLPLVFEIVLQKFPRPHVLYSIEFVRIHVSGFILISSANL